MAGISAASTVSAMDAASSADRHALLDSMSLERKAKLLAAASAQQKSLLLSWLNPDDVASILSFLPAPEKAQVPTSKQFSSSRQTSVALSRDQLRTPSPTRSASSNTTTPTSIRNTVSPDNSETAGPCTVTESNSLSGVLASLGYTALLEPLSLAGYDEPAIRAATLEELAVDLPSIPMPRLRALKLAVEQQDCSADLQLIKYQQTAQHQQTIGLLQLLQQNQNALRDSLQLGNELAPAAVSPSHTPEVTAGPARVRNELAPAALSPSLVHEITAGAAGVGAVAGAKTLPATLSSRPSSSNIVEPVDAVLCYQSKQAEFAIQLRWGCTIAKMYPVRLHGQRCWERIPYCDLAEKSARMRELERITRQDARYGEICKAPLPEGCVTGKDCARRA